MNRQRYYKIKELFMDKDLIPESEMNTEASVDDISTESEPHLTGPDDMGSRNVRLLETTAIAGSAVNSSTRDLDRDSDSQNNSTDKNQDSLDEQKDNQKKSSDKKLDEKEKKKAESSAKTMKKLKNSEKSVKHYQFFIIRLIIILIVLWVLFFKVVGITKMPNGDMFPRIDQGDFILFYRLEKNFKAQDVVVIEKVTPDSNGKKQIFVCRVVAVAGDTVEITDNQLLIVNGDTMIESNIFYQTPRYEGFTEYPITLKEGEIFVLADMRNGGHDSRYFGPITKDDIIGTVITILRRNGI